MAAVAAFVGALIPTVIVSRLILWALRRWHGGYLRLLVANAASWGIAFAAAGQAMAPIYAVAQAVWLGLDLWRWRRHPGPATAPLWVVLLAVLLVQGCAPSRQVPAGQIAYDTPENYQRLQRILQPIAIKNAELCRDSPIGVMPLGPGVEACALSVGISKSSALNAWTDGTNIALTLPMLAFLRSDDELAFILCHELAHIIERHAQTAKVGTFLGAFLDGAARGRGIDTAGGFKFVGSRIGSKDRETDADTIGAYLMARAGFDPRAGAWLWDRMPPGDSGWLASHPLSADRRAHLLGVAEEIRGKEKRDEPLTP